MEVNKDNYKTQLCNNYKKYGECKKGENCLYAHSETELRIKNKKCINDLKCFKKDCKFMHSEGWNYKNNTKPCIFYKNGNCMNNNCEFRHNLNENNITNADNDKNEENSIPEIEFCINGIEYEKHEEMFKNYEYIKKDKKNEDHYKKDLNEICEITNNLYLDIENQIIKFKNNLNKILQNKEYIEEDIKYKIDNINIETNKILSKLLLHKYNIDDIIRLT